MNYEESRLIFKEVKKAKRILVSCHRVPDPDAIGCSLAMYGVLGQMKKEVKIICPSQELFENLGYLKNFRRIEKNVNFSTFDFSKFEVFVVMDSSNWEMVSGLKNFEKPEINTIVIDHHHTNSRFGDINLVDERMTSTSEVLYLVFKDWGVDIEKETANSLLAGIIGDTGVFRYPGSDQRTLEIALELMNKGADKDELVYHIYMSEPFSLIKFYAEVLKSMKLEKRGKFAWAAIPYETYKKLGFPPNAKESAANMFAQIIDGTEFGFIILETKPGMISVSFRSRTGFDTSGIAKKLGGGGHIFASGAELQGLSFSMAVEKILRVVRSLSKRG